MTEVSESVSISTDAGATAELVADPAGISDWHPAIDSSEVEGDKRTVTLDDGGVVSERLTERGDSSYSYDVLEAPFPLKDLSAKLSVDEAGEGSTITWSASFEPDGISEAEGQELLSGFYRAGLDAAAGQLG